MANDNYSTLYTKYRDDSAILKTESYAEWSIPTIFADVSTSRDGKRVDVQRDYQSIGAILANHLASKLAQLLFPANQPFFRLDGSSDMGELAKAAGVDAADLSSKLADLENRAYRRIFSGASYHQIVHLMKLLICTGNALLFRETPTSKLIAYNMRQYAVLRDGAGTVLDMILKERVSLSTLPKEVQTLFKGREEYANLDMYTRIKRESRKLTDVFVVSQQIESHDVGEPSVYPVKICPYIPVVWNLIVGENYGRGLVEDFAGDFAKLSELSRALALYEIEACRVLHLVSPGTGADVDALNSAESGEFVSAKVGDVAAYEAGDFNKMSALLGDVQSIYQRLSPAFMYTGNTRNAERVTAEEIRMNAQEAEIGLGGVYSSLADTLHVPLAHILVNEIEPSFIQEVIAGGIDLEVLTGVSALGRSNNVTKLLEAANDIGLALQVFPAASKKFDMERIIDMILIARGVKLDDVYKTTEQLKQEQAAEAAPVPAPQLQQGVLNAPEALAQQGLA